MNWHNFTQKFQLFEQKFKPYKWLSSKFRKHFYRPLKPHKLNFNKVVKLETMFLCFTQVEDLSSKISLSLLKNI